MLTAAPPANVRSSSEGLRRRFPLPGVRTRRDLPGAVRDIGLLVLVSYVPLLLSRPGRVVFDTADGPFVNADRAFRLAASRWNPTAGLGSIADRAFNDGFPMVQWFWAAHHLAIPTWLAQRLWLGTILLMAGLGVRALLETIRWYGPGTLTASIAYACSPYLLASLGTRSVALLAWAALPWLIADTIRTVERPGWFAPARFAVAIGLVATAHLPSLVYVLAGPALWVVFAVGATREVTWRQALPALNRIVVLSCAVSAWWLVALFTDPGVILSDIRVATATDLSLNVTASDVLRGVAVSGRTAGEVFTQTASSSVYQSNPTLIVLSYIAPAIALTALCRVRFRNRLYFVGLIVLGMVLAVGSSPPSSPQPYGRLLSRLVETRIGALVAPTQRALPLTALGLAVGLATAVRALAQFRRTRRGLVEFAAVLLTVATVPSLILGEALDGPALQADDVGIHWRELAEQVNAGDPEYNVLELPGMTNTTYTWGTTNGPIGESLFDRPLAVRTPRTSGKPATLDLVAAFDEQMQARTLRPEAVAPLARMMSIDLIVVRNDMPGDAAAAEAAVDLLSIAPGVTERPGHGPIGEGQRPISLYSIDEPLPRVRTVGADHTAVVAGSGRGLVDMANAGLLTGDEVVFYAASFADRASFERLVGSDAPVVLTDSNAWTESVDPPLLQARPDSYSSVAYDQASDIDGVGSTGRATERPFLAFDDDPDTAWRFEIATTSVGPRLTIRYDQPVVASELVLTQPVGARHATLVTLEFDGFSSSHQRMPISDRPIRMEFPQRTFSVLTIAFDEMEPAAEAKLGGVSNVDLGQPPVSEKIVMPDDFVRLASADGTNPLTVVMTRRREPARRADREARIERDFRLPGPYTFDLSGTAETTGAVPPDVGCRSDLVTINGSAVPVQLTAQDGGSYRISRCSGSAKLEFTAGAVTLRTASQREADVVINQLVLESPRPSVPPSPPRRSPTPPSGTRRRVPRSMTPRVASGWFRPPATTPAGRRRSMPRSSMTGCSPTDSARLGASTSLTSFVTT